ncbi:ubiquitin activating enzyme (E1) subunit Aos1, putative [Plasmodium vivax]|uniref:Ubiquitin activating enzyme, putative n=6 Tax=Plasmodium vivax TaxID=5855 RepID=A5K5A3_PLAVS|nr:ubiquitin activating enzyme, putative [Plasmodium vivax]KMZ82327.1 ubiquitin activating enzyme [Plasmodium vivax India VII]KMZ86583.1 ubiquitin activating enzyme [Plasmodium vivax Brazil I]KMZ92997.1 ubiquitin activating enzyme [Plasmodium vivax Mauritania I]KMZ99442.1 ubiquitin activating enzyme [Plasmodium vivax North Korean]EDL45831.1 ubiquitin activating enzyme, putative [Plasmodium vivax]|eukprot:XP_001615558.1 ubiquitin activating enzyme [Plasmodium vivax Sal-1]
MKNNEEWEKEKIYDRQLRLWGVKAQNRMMKSNVLILGLSGINIEICKNLILNGINITIIDDNIVDEEMVENIFFLNESDIQNYACVAIFKELKSINKMINMKAYIGRMDTSNDSIIIESELVQNADGEISNTKMGKTFSVEKYISNYTSVCVSCEDYPLYKLVKMNEFCHEKNIGFFAAMCNGKFAFLFSDFGNHVIEESYYKAKEGQRKGETGANKAGELQKEGETGANNGGIPIQYCTLSHFLKVPFENFDKKTNKIIFPMFALILFELNKQLNKSDKSIDEQEFSTFCDQFSLAKCKESLGEITKTYRVAFSPSCSIMGGVTSQEIRKFVSKQHESIPNFCVFDMNQSVVCTSMIS